MLKINSSYHKGQYRHIGVPLPYSGLEHVASIHSTQYLSLHIGSVPYCELNTNSTQNWAVPSFQDKIHSNVTIYVII